MTFYIYLGVAFDYTINQKIYLSLPIFHSYRNYK